MTDEREDWDALTKSPGWQRLLAFAKTCYSGSAYKDTIGAAIKAQDLTKAATFNAIVDEVNLLLSYPMQRLHDLDKTMAREKEARAASPGRRGGL
jgi:hypothetical protein